MKNPAGKTGELFNPFPGLRPFTQEESHLFFGREGQSKSVLTSLEANDFVAVIGASGSGKSSLIYCGVIPDLQTKSGDQWMAVSMRPGNNPVGNLIAAFSEAFAGKLGDADTEKILSGELTADKLFSSFIPEGKSLLLIVDQFEEIFRYTKSAVNEGNEKESNRFVQFIHTACTTAALPVRVVITMRSDFIGECSIYQDLTDLINKSNYLIPQMTRDDFRKAIEGPIGVGGATIDKSLVNQLLDEVGENTDQLPVLQHALMRTWDYWQLQNDPEKPISVGDYEAIGRMEKALSDHANEAYDELDENERSICEYLFKTITEKGGDNRGIRRPASIKRIAAITRASSEEIMGIAEAFRIKGRTFLTPYQPVVLGEDTVIDISHESLMRIWDRLRLWVDEEAGSVQMYNKLSDAAELYQKGTTGLWRPPDLQLALNWREKQQPTATWAVQYNPAFERAMVFLDASDTEFKKEEENKIRLQKRRLRVTRIFSLILGGIAVIAMGLFLWTRDLQSQEAEQRQLAEENEKLATERQQEALAARDSAIFERERADIARKQAEDALKEAEEARAEANRQAGIAETRRKEAAANAEEARLARILAEQNADTAEIRRLEAEAASRLAQERRMLSIAKSMAVKSLQIDSTDDPDLKALLAFQAFLFNIEFGGPRHESDIYAGLYDARKALLGASFNRFTGHIGTITSIVFMPGSDIFFSGGTDGKILKHVLSDTTRSYETISTTPYLFQDFALSQGGRYLVAATNTQGILVYDTEDLAGSPRIFMEHEGKIRDVAFSSDDQVFYSFGLDKRILRWDLEAGTASEVANAESRFNDMAISSDGTQLAASDRSGNIYIINLENPSIVDTIPGPVLNPVFSLDFSSDGKYLAAGDLRGNVRIIETENWNQTTSLRGSSARIESVSFSPESKYLASSSYDGNVLMWEMADLTNSPIVMEDNRGFVFTVGFSPDEQYIISGSESLVARPVKASMLSDGICGMLNRNFIREEWDNYIGPDIPYLETCTMLFTEK